MSKIKPFNKMYLSRYSYTDNLKDGSLLLIEDEKCMQILQNSDLLRK